MTDFIFNVLDQSPVTSATNPAQAVAETIALAEHTDTLGYRRFWLAEHHNTSAFAGAAPEILIGHIASRTRHLRVGSGGIMLPHYSPMKVAEVFRMHPSALTSGSAARPAVMGARRLPCNRVQKPGPRKFSRSRWKC